MIRIVKRSKKSSWPSWGRQRRTPFFSNRNQWRNLLKMYLPTIILASWLGTYLDVILVNNHLYSFPLRPFADVFPFNILFTLLVLPVVTVVTVHLLQQMNLFHKILSILILAFVMTFIEILSEKIGWFVHSAAWQHYFTFFGYLVFMWIIFWFHRYIQS